MKVQEFPTYRLIRRYLRDYYWAASVSKDTTDEQIASAMQKGEVAFYSYNETAGCYLGNRPRRIRR